MEDVNVPELVRQLGSEDDSMRKMGAFKLQTAIGDPSFADVFIYQGGLPKLEHLALTATGNTLAYTLASFTNLLGLDQGWEWISKDLIERLVQLVVGHPLVNILRGAMAILAAVVSHPSSNAKDSNSFGFEALKPALEGHTQFLEMLVSRLSSADHSLCVNALQLINALMRDAMLGNHDAEWHQFVQQLKTFGVITSVHHLMQETALQDLAHPLLEFQTLTKLMLRKWRETPIDLEKQEHRRALRAIHFAANPERKDKREKENENENESEGQEDKKKHDTHKWRKLGFTSESPASDFDQVGYLGLMDLQDFSKKSEDGFQRLLLEQQTKEPEYRCPIARACISVTSILYDHFEIDEADITDHQQYVALDSHSNFGKLFKPLLLQRSRLHTSGVKAFLRLWEATGAETEDFPKIEDLTRVLIEQVVTMAPRTREVAKVEEEIAGDWDLNRLRELQMELMEFSHEEAWGRHLRQVKEELHHEALQFMKEQRIRCLLQGTWFPNQPSNPAKTENGVNNNGNAAQPQSRRQSWRYVKLSHNRRDLHYDDFEFKTAAGKEPTLESLEHKLDLSVVSSVVSNVGPSSRDRSDSASSGSTVRTTSKPGHGRRGSETNRRSHTNTEIVIHGRVSSNAAQNTNNTSNASKDNSRNHAPHHHHTGGSGQHNQREISSRSTTHTASNTPGGSDEETALLTLHPASQTLASEWLDGMLLLLNQAPITAETNKLVDFIAKYGLRIRLLNVRFEEDGFVNGEASRKVDIPGHDGIDEDYFYDIGGGV